VTLIALAFELALLLYRFVEEPLRRSPDASSLGQAKTHVAGSAQMGRPVEGLKRPNCFSETVAAFDRQCSESPSPEMLLWGDSNSAHLVPGLAVRQLRGGRDCQ